MWKRSSVFISGPFFSMCRMSIVSCIVPLEFGLLDRVACICSLYLVLKFLPVCPIYLNWNSLHFIWHILLLLYLSVFCFLGWGWFCIVFLVLYATRIFVFYII
jgi:hypothetical protein